MTKQSSSTTLPFEGGALQTHKPLPCHTRIMIEEDLKVAYDTETQPPHCSRDPPSLKDDPSPYTRTLFRSMRPHRTRCGMNPSYNGRVFLAPPPSRLKEGPFSPTNLLKRQLQTACESMTWPSSSTTLPFEAGFLQPHKPD